MKQKLVAKIGGETGCHGCGFTVVVEAEVEVGKDGRIVIDWPTYRRNGTHNVADVEIEVETEDIDDA